MFDKMPIMASRGQVKSLFKYFHLYHYFNVVFHFCKFHGVGSGFHGVGSGLGLGPEKVIKKSESLAQN